MTGYEKMIRILHQKDMMLLEANVADDYLWIYEMKMWTKDDFLKQMSELFQTNIVRDKFFDEECQDFYIVEKGSGIPGNYF